MIELPRYSLDYEGALNALDNEEEYYIRDTYVDSGASEYTPEAALFILQPLIQKINEEGGYPDASIDVQDNFSGGVYQFIAIIRP